MKRLLTVLTLVAFLLVPGTAFAQDNPAIQFVNQFFRLNQYKEIQVSKVDGEALTRTYTWEYKDKKYEHTFEIPLNLWENCINQPKTLGLADYVTDLNDDSFLRYLSHELIKNKDFTSREIIEFIAAFVQHLDTVGTQLLGYPQYPVETLVEQAGDCRDTSILLASLLRELGFDCVLLLFQDSPGHIGVGVNSKLSGTYFADKNTPYYYLETTEKSWTPGKVPEKYRGHEARIEHLTCKPMVAHTVHTEKLSLRAVEVTVTVSNTGSAPTNAQVYVSLPADAGRVHDQKLSDEFTLGPGGQKTMTFRLFGPPKHEQQVTVKIVDGVKVLDESGGKENPTQE